VKPIAMECAGHPPVFTANSPVVSAGAGDAPLEVLRDSTSGGELPKLKRLRDELLDGANASSKRSNYNHVSKNPCLLSLPDYPLVLIFDALGMTLSRPEFVMVKDVSPVTGVVGRSWTKSVLALASTCTRMNWFLRFEYASALSLSSYSQAVPPPKPWLPDDVARALSRLPRLSALNLCGCELVARNIEVALFSGTGVARRITCLELQSANLTPSNLRAVVKACPLVEKLDVRDNLLLDDESICNALKAYVGTLCTLDVSDANISDVAGREIANARLLFKLSLSSSMRLTDDTFVRFSALQEMLELDLTANVTDAGMIAMLRGMTKLRQLVLGSCRQLTSAFLIALPASLNHLELSGTAGMNDHSSVETFRALPNLAEFTLSYPRCCFTQWSNFEFVGAQLQALHLGRIPMLGSGAGLLAEMIQLRVLNLVHCDWVCDETVHAAASLPQLHAIEVSGINDVSPSGATLLAYGAAGATLRGIYFRESELATEHGDRLTEFFMSTLTRLEHIEFTAP
jgi:hypothetical protein